MIRLKEGVRLTNLCPQMVTAMHIVNEQYIYNGVFECWITSGSDGIHKPTSLHYKGQALDFRLHNVPVLIRSEVIEKIKAALLHGQGQYEVYHESVGTDNEHLHVEYDPKPSP